MPKLILFAPCERAIVDDGGKQASLINILEGLTVNLGADVPEDATVPIPWTAFSMWSREEDEMGEEFEQRVQLLLPNGESYGEATLAFKLGRPHHRVRQSFIGLRVGMPGTCIVKLSVRPVGDESKWQDVAEYPIEITHTAEEAPPTESEVKGEEAATETVES